MMVLKIYIEQMPPKLDTTMADSIIGKCGLAAIIWVSAKCLIYWPVLQTRWVTTSGLPIQKLKHTISMPPLVPTKEMYAH